MHASRRLIAAAVLNLVLTSLALAAGPEYSEPSFLVGGRTESAVPLALGAMGYGYSGGDAVGTSRSGVNCAERAEPKEWSELLAQRANAELRQAFEAQQITLPGRADTSGAPVRITPFLNDLQFDLCGAGRIGWQGKVRVQIAWTVSSPATERIVYQASTEGVFVQPAAAAGHPTDGLRKAMAAAVAQLYKDRRFALALASEDRTLTASR